MADAQPRTEVLPDDWQKIQKKIHPGESSGSYICPASSVCQREPARQVGNRRFFPEDVCQPMVSQREIWLGWLQMADNSSATPKLINRELPGGIAFWNIVKTVRNPSSPPEPSDMSDSKLTRPMVLVDFDVRNPYAQSCVQITTKQVYKRN